MSNVSILRYLGVFAQIAVQWEVLKGLPVRQPYILPPITTRVHGRRMVVKQTVEFEE